MDKEKVTLKIKIYEILLVIGIIMVIIGAIAPLQCIEILEMTIWLDPNLWILSILGMALIFGYITYRILKRQKYAFLWGAGLGLIGVIVAICIKSNNTKSDNSINQNYTSKYEDLEKLMKLKQDGILTEVEYEIEKSKLLK